MGQYFLKPKVVVSPPKEARAVDLEELRERGVRVDHIREALERIVPDYDYYGFVVETEGANSHDRRGLLIYIPLASYLADKLVREAE